MSLFLTKEDIAELTGYVRPADQCRRLRERGWHFEENANGRPIVSRSYYEKRMGGEVQQTSWAPNVAVLRKRG